MKIKNSQIIFQIFILIFLVFPSLLYSQACKDYVPSTWMKKKLTYQERINGCCEGFIKDEVSASRFEVVSFTYGKFTYDSKNAETIYLQAPKQNSYQVNVEAKGIPFDLDYRMDAIISDNNILFWETNEVLLHNERTKFYKNIGVTGYLEVSKGSKVFVPLRIVDNEYDDYLFFIIRSNGSLRNIKWKTNIGTSWQHESGSYEKGDPVQLVFEYKSQITEIELQGVNGDGDLITIMFNLKLQ